MNGRDRLAAHVPDLSAGRGLLIALFALAAFGSATALMAIVDWLWPAWTGLGQATLVIAGFAWTGQFFWRRREYRMRWGARAYRNAFGRHVLVGLPIILATIAHNAYLPGKRVIVGWATPAAAMLGLYLLITGLVLWARAVFTLGIDNLAMLYVYFPEESRLVESSIYGIVRHPIYSAVVRIGLALGLWRGTWFSVAFGLFMPVGLTLWLRLAEEPELTERFGTAYADYRRAVPAFWPRVSTFSVFWHYLIRGQEPRPAGG